MPRHVTVALLSFALFASVVPTPAAADPTDQTLRVVAGDSRESQLRFHADGRVVATFDGRSVAGRWSLGRDGLCFRWSEMMVECWPYVSPFVKGQTVTVTSSRGNVVRVTRL